MKLSTPVNLPRTNFHLSPQMRIVSIGSCFAQNMGELMQMSGLEIEVNPMGVLYNPISIAKAIDLLLSGEMNENMIFKGQDGLWHSWMHSGRFSKESKDECLRHIKERLHIATKALKEADVLIVTFGTNRYYTLKNTQTEGEQGKNTVVANCHKEPATIFNEKEINVEEFVNLWRELIERLPIQTKVVMTISPYRYAKYGFHESQVAKANLLLGVEQICKEFPERVHYFPAYEIVLDELRDYRFFDADMLHPSAQAIEYVWERFQEWAFTPEAIAQAVERRREARRKNHRPIRE